MRNIVPSGVPGAEGRSERRAADDEVVRQREQPPLDEHQPAGLHRQGRQHRRQTQVGQRASMAEAADMSLRPWTRDDAPSLARTLSASTS